MILIIHGNDIASSRNLYFEEKNKFKNPVFINGDNITFDKIFQALENKSFFEETPAIIIENFFSKNKSNTNEFKEIASYLNSKKDLSIILWENSEISKTALSQFGNATVKAFSFPQNLFSFLDNIKPNNSANLITFFNELRKTMEPELILFMMIRQFRLLIALSDLTQDKIDEVKRLAPWQTGKLKRQVSYFGENKIVEVYNKLFEVELNQKTGRVSFPLEKSIDFFLLGL